MLRALLKDGMRQGEAMARLTCSRYPAGFIDVLLGETYHLAKVAVELLGSRLGVYLWE